MKSPRAARIALFLVLALLTSAVPGLGLGCARAPELGVRAESFARPAPPDGPLRRLDARVEQEGAPGDSGFFALEGAREAFSARLALVDSAVSTLDFQYYLWTGDAAGDLLARRAVAAAERGVRVRILIDDFLVSGDGTGAAVLAQHANLEIRLYNPWRRRNVRFARQGLEWMARPELNRRMHNKLLVADNRVAIVGGRNIANEYFGVSERANFKDLDVLAAGPAAAALSATFDEFWNDEWAYPAEALAPEPDDADRARVRALLEATPSERERLASFPLTVVDWTPLLTELSDELSFGQWLAVSDAPPSGAGPPDHVFVSIGQMVLEARHEIVVVSAYFVPDDAMLDAFARYTAAGIRVRILTNSLGSNNHAIVNSQYKKYRKRLLEAGVELYEMRYDPVDRASIDTPPIDAEKHVLHTKAVLIDRDRMYVGALNVSPRSIRLNSENGLLVRDAALVGALAESIDRDLEPANAWRVTRDEDGRLLWESAAGVVRRQPARTAWQRVEDWLFGLFPLESQI